MGSLDPANAVVTDAQGRFAIGAPIGRVRVYCDPVPSTPMAVGAPFSNAGGDVDVAAGDPAHIELFQVRIVSPPSDIGFQITPITLPLVVRSVDPAGPAAAGGLAAGDRVITIDGASLAGLLPFSAMVLALNHRPGSTMTLGIERAGAPIAVKVNISKLAN